jgi:hypothetical protein
VAEPIGYGRLAADFPLPAEGAFPSIRLRMPIKACMSVSSKRRGACALCALFLEAARSVTIAVVSSRKRKRRQPGLATDDPAFVGWHQLVGGIQGSEVHFDLVCGAGENGRAAAGTEEPPAVVARFAVDRHRILREYRGSVKKRPMMLAAIETVTKADPVWPARGYDADVSAQTTARISVHARLLQNQAGGKYLQRTGLSAQLLAAERIASPDEFAAV